MFKKYIEKIKQWIRKRIRNILNFFASKVFIPRLWTKKEWDTYSSKEKVWIWYKHHDQMMSVGNGELDKILPFLKGEFLTTAGIFAVLFVQLGLPQWTLLLYPILYVGYKLFQWYIGDQIDKRDLIALSSEIGSRRTIAFREIRSNTKKEKWRKKK